MSDFLWPHGLQHARLPCPSPSLGACSNSCPFSRWWHLTTSYSVTPFSSGPQPFLASGSFPMSWLFASGGQKICKIIFFNYKSPEKRILWRTSSLVYRTLKFKTVWYLQAKFSSDTRSRNIYSQVFNKDLLNKEINFTLHNACQTCHLLSISTATPSVSAFIASVGSSHTAFLLLFLLQGTIHITTKLIFLKHCFSPETYYDIFPYHICQIFYLKLPL